MHGTRILEEADRLMTVCNSCRYCEGLCAVFPAMEMRRAFSDGDLNYLANLCHSCGACYTDCQFSPPHEFNVNVPKTLAVARADSYAAYAWPRALSGAVRAQRPRHQPGCRAQRRRFHLRLCRLPRPPGAVRYPYRPRRVLQTDAAQHDGGAVRRGVPLCDRSARHGRARVLARHRRARRHEDRRGRAVAGDPRCRRVALSRWRRRRLLQRGRPPDRSPQALSPFDVLRLCAVLRLDLRRDALSLSAGARGALSVVGPAGRARHARRHRTADRADRPAGREIEARSRVDG